MTDETGRIDSEHETTDEAMAEDPGPGLPDHPHAGVAAEGWSSPEAGAARSAGCALLVLKRGGGETEHTYPINPPAIIGRFDPEIGPIDVDLGPLPEGHYVSRKHAKITCEDGAWKLSDLGSSNGTYILRDDFERVEEAELKDGDELALGNVRFVFRLEGVVC